MAKIHVTSGNGGDLDGSHDSWKDEILIYEPTELDQIMQKYDRYEERFAGSLPGTDGSNCISAAPEAPMPMAGVRRSGSQEEPSQPMITRVASPAPQFRRHGEAPAHTDQAPAAKREPIITVTTTMTRMPLPFAVRKPQTPIDPFAQRRADAQKSFQESVQRARQHAANVMAKLGNAK